MARARNIKPSFFQDDKLGELEPLARLAFIGMWTLADFKGCIEYRPKMLKVQLLPYDECDIEQISKNLEQFRFIRFYVVNEKTYIKIVNFEKHQNPHKNEREAGSEIPDIPDCSNKNNDMPKDGTKTEKIGTARADSLLLIPDSLNTDSLNTDTGFPDIGADAPQPKKSALKILVELGCEKQHAEDWLAVRKAKRAPLTKTALDDMQSEAVKAGITLADAVAICARKNWQGFNASWDWQGSGSAGRQTAQQLRDARTDAAINEFLTEGGCVNGECVEVLHA